MSYRIPYARPHFPANSEQSLISTFRSGQISGSGLSTSEFEELLQKKLDCRFAITTSNGSIAIQLAFQTLGLMQNDLVILPGWGFHVAANVAYNMGAKVLFRDVSLDSWCMELDFFEDIGNSGKRVFIVLVHTLGNSADLKMLAKLRSNPNILIIEDAAEALFSKFGDRYLGTIGDIGTFSLHAAKTITTGEGGFVLTQRSDLEERIKLIKNHGMRPQRPYFHELPGSNFRLSNLLSCLAVEQMKDLDFILTARRRVYDRYYANLSDKDHSYFFKNSDPTGFFPWAVGVLLKEGTTVKAVRNRLLSAGIDSRPGFSSASDLPYYFNSGNKDPLNNSKLLSRRVILLPHYPSLNNKDVDTICEIVKNGEN